MGGAGDGEGELDPGGGGGNAFAWEVESDRHPGTDLWGWLLGRKKRKGGEGRAEAKVGHWAERKLW
jgi:hypothetical protein